MRVRNKEHQSLGVKELEQLCKDFPNDQQLGKEIRKITRRALVNNPKGLRATTGISDITKEELKSWEID
jgi:hypothetical protein